MADAASRLPDDVLVEILARVPYRSLCRFKCVSKPWLALCSDPGLRERSPQTLSGFFVSAHGNQRRGFLNLSRRGFPLVDPSLPFLGCYQHIQIMDCCGGLLLCKCLEKSSPSVFDSDYDYVVCNPATGKWIVLPYAEMLHSGNFVGLGFNPAVPTRFHVFVIVLDWDNFITGVEIYSSDTGRWTPRMQSEWLGLNHMDHDDLGYVSAGRKECVFFNGALHFTTNQSSVLAVDTEGKTWRKFQMPHTMARSGDYGFIAQSQGRLYAMHTDQCNDCQLSVWVLEDYGSGQWTLKHTLNVLELFGRHHRQRDEFYKLIAIHPERNLIFLIDGVEETLVSCDLDNPKVHVLCTSEEYSLRSCLPYHPCFVECLSDGQ